MGANLRHFLGKTFLLSSFVVCWQHFPSNLKRVVRFYQKPWHILSLFIVRESIYKKRHVVGSTDKWRHELICNMCLSPLLLPGGCTNFFVYFVTSQKVDQSHRTLQSSAIRNMSWEPSVPFGMERMSGYTTQNQWTDKDMYLGIILNTYTLQKIVLTFTPNK